MRSVEHEVRSECSFGIRQRVEKKKLFREGRSVDYPDHTSVERLARTKLFERHGRVLEFDHEPAICFHVGHVLLAGVFVVVHDFLVLDWKESLPIGVPRRFVFRPRITVPLARVSPMPYDFGAALRDGCFAASRASPRRATNSRLSFTVD